jgi:hypothetical protein
MMHKCGLKDKILQDIDTKRERRFNPRTGRGPDYIYLVHHVDSDIHEKNKETEKQENEGEKVLYVFRH